MSKIQENIFNKTVREMHEMLGTTNKCYILCCGEDATTIVVQTKTGEKNFYCDRCAKELVSTFPNLFEEKR